MTGGPCRVPECGAIVADAFVCSTCAHRLTVALTDAPGLLAELDIEVTRQSRSGARVGSRSAERPLPFDPSASLIRDALVSTLRTWCLVLQGDILGDPPADAHLVKHLADRIEAVRHHIEGGTLVDEVSAAVTAAREHLLATDRDPSTLAGHCPDCGHTVYARQGAAVARCRVDGCPGVVDVATARQEALQRLNGMAMTAADAARALTALDHPVSAARIRKWASRGHLVPVWADQMRRPLYLLADIRALLTTKDAS